MLTKFFTFSRFTLFVALCISAIAAYYSVIGLTAIFAGAVIPIIVMGAILEIAKITTTVWLHKYWDRATWTIKTYLTVAVIALACLTSMGIFGLLSKAHSDTGLVSGDVAAKVALIDEKIKTQRDNADAARKALQQLDEQVNQRLSRGDSEQGAERAVQIRRQQAPERAKLQKEIGEAQAIIAKLNEERAPIAASQRKVEAEVGPIKYIAALIYGDNPDTNLLEKAVRWVIIMIVIVFDPLAIVLILAANNSLKWEKEDKVIESKQELNPIVPDPVTEKIEEVTEPIEELIEDTEETMGEPILGETDEWREKISAIENSTPWPIIEPVKPTKARRKKIKEVEPVEEPIVIEEVKPEIEVSDLKEEIKVEPLKDIIIETDGITKEIFVKTDDNQYVEHEGKSISLDALKQLHPELVVKNAPSDLLFGVKFPSVAKKGDIYTRVDIMPNKVFKFNGSKWVEIDKGQNTTYLQNIAYIQYLISKIDSGEYDPEFLTVHEQDEISEYLKRTT